MIVWEEDSRLQQLPCSQFSLVVEWEASGEASPCVRQCMRQNIRVVSFTFATGLILVIFYTVLWLIDQVQGKLWTFYIGVDWYDDSEGTFLTNALVSIIT